MSEKRKRTALDLDVKFEIINEIENGRKQSVVCCARNLPKQTVNSLWRDREKIKQMTLKHF